MRPWTRRRVVVATKLRFPASDPGGQGLDADRVRAACDASLRRLGIDEIDLYQVHAPTRRFPWSRRSRRSTDSRGRARSAPSACPTSRDGSWRGRWRCRIARAGRRSSRCNRSTPSSSVPSSSTCCRSAAPQGSACCPGVRSAPGSSAERTGATRRRRRRAAWRRRATTGRRRWPVALLNATSGSSTRSRKLPRSATSPSLQWRSPGCSVSTV
ncbi:MAG: aldo/keto reductase [Acidimicrobiia bacterium]|nr:aldo/keto reductase [Acidimicrobiia bacterium]